MLLDRIDIDEHGPLNRVELGPLGEQLNVVFAPLGSGKTAIARFIRDTLVDRQYPTGMLSSSSGRVVWATRSGLVHCHREHDGTRQGRKRVQFEPRGMVEPQFDGVQSAWLDSVASSRAIHRSMDTIELPESIVDGVITDTAVTNVAKIVASCLRHGIDSADTYRSLPMIERAIDSIDAEEHHQVRAELASIDAELARLGNVDWDHSALVARRQRLSAQLAGWYAPHDREFVDYRDPRGYRYATDSRYAPYRAAQTYEQVERRSRELHSRVRQLRSRQSELRTWITELEHRSRSPKTSHRSLRDIEEQLDRSRSNLERLTTELNTCLADAADVRRSMRWTDGRPVWMDRDAVVAELRRVDDRLAAWSRRDWLLSRQHRLRQQLGYANSHTDQLSASPLATLASQWLVRVSGGRLDRVDWTSQAVGTGKQQRQRVSVRMNGRPESDYSPSDRAVTAMAIRLAAGELLARTGRHVPLVVETQREMWQTQPKLSDSDPRSAAYFQSSQSHRFNHPLVAALHDYAAGGRQVIVLTSDQPLVDELARSGARSFDVQHQRIVHEHRPVWRSHAYPEAYVGPHPHLYGDHDVEPVRYSAPRREPVGGTIDDINHSFDLASHFEAPADPRNDFPTASNPPTGRHNHVVTDWAADDVTHRDGYFYADTYTTIANASGSNESTSRETCCCKQNDRRSTIAKPQSPFLLSVDSPIDQAPSIDAVAAARLRGLKVTHVTHLMQQDANRLADALGMATVSAATVRQWQAESRLCCRVPQLRNFDARILVGCGITTPAQLASIHPTDLLHEVEAFLTTEQGQRILRSGSSQELSRITTWIATANSGSDADITLNGEVVRRSHQSTSTASASHRTYRDGSSSGEHRRETDSSTGRRQRTRRDSRRRDGQSVPSNSERSSKRRSRRSSSARTRHTGSRRRQSLDRGSEHRFTTVEPEIQPARDVVQYEEATVETTWRFYLERQSPVEDAPSIGSRMAERLAEVGIVTVNDLLESDPGSVAEALELKRVDTDTVVQWQQQATLVCCVPMLRGHDAQLLVAAEVTSPEELTECNAEDLFALVDPISQSSQGKRILRGGKQPDLAEVTDWISFAQHTRELKAA
ncbi:MAG: DUF4332 domain-containing protein [Planctomycetota bacterium]